MEQRSTIRSTPFTRLDRKALDAQTVPPPFLTFRPPWGRTGRCTLSAPDNLTG